MRPASTIYENLVIKCLKGNGIALWEQIPFSIRTISTTLITEFSGSLQLWDNRASSCCFRKSLREATRKEFWGNTGNNLRNTFVLFVKFSSSSSSLLFLTNPNCNCSFLSGWEVYFEGCSLKLIWPSFLLFKVMSFEIFYNEIWKLFLSLPRNSLSRRALSNST